MEVDHVIPLSRGGSNTFENMRWVTKEANCLKRAMLDDELVEICFDVIAFTATGKANLNKAGYYGTVRTARDRRA